MGTLLHVIKDICTEATAIHSHGHPTNRPPFFTDTATATVGPTTTNNPPSSTLIAITHSLLVLTTECPS